MMSPARPRLYGGRTKDDREATRRAQLVEAAISLAARGGRDAVTVSNVCAQAGLTTRYFYESFASRESLFVEAFRVVAERLVEAMKAAASKPDSDPTRAFFETLAAFPGEAKVFLVDIDAYEESLAELRQSIATTISRLIVPNVGSRLGRAGALGALLAVGRQWTRRDFVEPIGDVVAIAQAFGSAAGARG